MRHRTKHLVALALALTALAPHAASAAQPGDPDFITVLPGTVLEPGQTAEFGPESWIQYVPEYKAMTIFGEGWPGLIITEYWTVLYGQAGAVSAGELWLMKLPEEPPQAGARPICRTPDGRVFQSTADRC